MSITSNTSTQPALLDDREEQLLARFFDGECNYLQRIRARRLLRRRAEARQYLAALEGLHTVAHTAHQTQAAFSGPSADLWNKISRRIDEEQRAAIFLGRREVQTSPAHQAGSYAAKRGFSMRIPLEQLLWGAGGALVATSMTLMVGSGSGSAGSHEALFANLQQSLDDASDEGRLARTNSAQEALLEKVAGSQSSAHTRSQLENLPATDTSEAEALRQFALLDPRGEMRSWEPNYSASRSPIDLDWVRGAGRVRVMQGPSDRSPILWVDRNSDYKSPATRSFVPRGQQRIVVLDRRVPQGITVSDSHVR